MTEHKATPHRAKPESWAFIEKSAPRYSFESCLLELRDRVEALEAAAKPVESNAPESSDSLVKLVADAIYGKCTRGLDEETRAAILAVADWLDQQGWRVAAKRLRMEAQ